MVNKIIKELKSILSELWILIKKSLMGHWAE